MYKKIKSGLVKSFSKGSELLFGKSCIARTLLSQNHNLQYLKECDLETKGLRPLYDWSFLRAPSVPSGSEPSLRWAHPDVFFCWSPRSLKGRRADHQGKAWGWQISCLCYPGSFAASTGQCPEVPLASSSKTMTKTCLCLWKFQSLPSQPVLSSTTAMTRAPLVAPCSLFNDKGIIVQADELKQLSNCLKKSLISVLKDNIFRNTWGASSQFINI